jgi:hypothetical protein
MGVKVLACEIPGPLFPLDRSLRPLNSSFLELGQGKTGETSSHVTSITGEV